MQQWKHFAEKVFLVYKVMTILRQTALGQELLYRMGENNPHVTLVFLHLWHSHLVRWQINLPQWYLLGILRPREIVDFTTAFTILSPELPFTSDVIRLQIINGRGHKLVCGYRNSCSILWWKFLIHSKYLYRDMSKVTAKIVLWNGCPGP